MPFKAPAQIKCPRCDKSVYAAESRVVGDLSFHKECFKCSMCNKMLDSTNINCHERVLYCKFCHGRKFGPKGYGFGGGAAGLSMDTGAHLENGNKGAVGQVQQTYKPPKAKSGEGCPRCGGCVYSAEEVLAKGKTYHKSCFNCKSCRKPLDSMLHCDGPDKEVYCKVCYSKEFGPKGYGFGSGGGTLQSDPSATPMVRPHGNPDQVIAAKEGQEACPRCGGKVFSAEMMMAKDRGFHKKCFKCLNCKRPLDSMTHCDGTDGEVYCKLCYAKKYGPKGYGFAAGAGGVLTAENIPGGAEIDESKAAKASIDVSAIQAVAGEGCPRCGGKVFAAEEINARGRSFHKRCYNCCHCHRPLDSVVGCDSPDGEVYCKLCYAKKYGPKGYGFAAGGGGVMVAENIKGNDEHQVKAVSDSARLDVSKIQAKAGEGCPRCGGKVFMAEEMHARGRSFHKRCYNCCHCHRPLDSMTGCDSPDGEVYCKLCYAKKYGPKGYGFAAGGGGVLTAENIPGGQNKDALVNVNPTFAAIDTTCITGVGDENCPRCGGKVFSAEERLSGGGIKWHKRCYSCRDCHRPLDSMILCDGPDSDIYCKLCYAKRFGPKGYGFAAGSGGVLVPENIDLDDDGEPIVRSLNTNAAGALDVSRIQAKAGQSGCPRCGGAVYQAEAIPVRGKEWHKPCYNCCECHRPLDSMTGNDAPDGEVYCRLCYAKRHGPKGYGYGHCPSLISLGTTDGAPIPTDIRQFGFGPKIVNDWKPPGANLARLSEEEQQHQKQLHEQHQQQKQPQQQQQQPNGQAPSSRWGAAQQGQEVKSVKQVIPPPEPLPIGSEIPIPRGFNPEFPWGLPLEEAERLSEEEVAQMQEFAQLQHQHMQQVSETDNAIAAADLAALHLQQQQQQQQSVGVRVEQQPQQQQQHMAGSNMSQVEEHSVMNSSAAQHQFSSVQQQQQQQQQFISMQQQQQEQFISMQQQQLQQVQQETVQDSELVSDENADEDVEIVYEEVEVEDGEEEGEYEYEEELIEEEEQDEEHPQQNGGQHMTSQEQASHLQHMTAERRKTVVDMDGEEVEPYMQADMSHDMSDGGMSHQMSQMSHESHSSTSGSTKVVTRQTTSSSVTSSSVTQESYSTTSGMVRSQFESQQ